MTDAWRVDPHAAHAATVATRTAADDVAAAGRAIANAIDDGCDALGATGSHDALAALRDDPFGIEVRSVVEHIRTAADQVDAAVAAFDDGDAQMSEQFRRAQGGVALR